MTKVDSFLKKHKISDKEVNIHKLVESFASEMIKGLAGKKSSLRMIPTYIEAENEFISGVKVVAIDAGGTNFRVATVGFNKQGKLEISKLVNYKMPGLEGEISSEEFFQIIAGYIKPYVEESDRIGFCFFSEVMIYARPKITVACAWPSPRTRPGPLAIARSQFLTCTAG